MIPGPYNNYYQIVQTRDTVAIEVEMIHDVRIIPLDGRPHLPSAIRQWMGDSVGHWEDDTLVVDTTNFTDQTHYRGADRNLHVVERFTLDPDHQHMTAIVKVEDPDTFNAPLTMMQRWFKAKGRMIETVCAENNVDYFSQGLFPVPMADKPDF